MLYWQNVWQHWGCFLPDNGIKSLAVSVFDRFAGGRIAQMDEITQELGKAMQELNEKQSRKEFGAFPTSLSVDAFQVSKEIEEYFSKRDKELEKCRNLSVGVYQ